MVRGGTLAGRGCQAWKGFTLGHRLAIGRRNMFTDDNRHDADSRDNSFSQSGPGQTVPGQVVVEAGESLPEWWDDELTAAYAEYQSKGPGRTGGYDREAPDPLLTRYKAVKFPNRLGKGREGEEKASRKVLEDVDLKGKRKSAAKKLLPSLEKYNSARAKRLKGCGSYVVQSEWYRTGIVTTDDARFCHQPKLCVGCAHAESVNKAKAYSARAVEVLRKNPDLRPVLITFTVRNGKDLKERLDHLNRARVAIKKRRENYAAGMRGYTVFGDIVGGVGSIEIKRGKGGLWHPHLHMLALVPKSAGWEFQTIGDEVVLIGAKFDDFRREWTEITVDSFVVNVKPLNAWAVMDNGLELQVDLVMKEMFEVLKYPFKPGEMSPVDTLHAFDVTQKMRLVHNFGFLYNVKVPESYLDDPKSGVRMQSSFLYEQGRYVEVQSVLNRRVVCRWEGVEVVKDDVRFLGLELHLSGLEGVDNLWWAVQQYVGKVKANASAERSGSGDSVAEMEVHSFDWIDQQAGTAIAVMISPRLRSMSLDDISELNVVRQHLAKAETWQIMDA